MLLVARCDNISKINNGTQITFLHLNKGRMTRRELLLCQLWKMLLLVSTSPLPAAVGLTEPPCFSRADLDLADSWNNLCTLQSGWDSALGYVTIIMGTCYPGSPPRPPGGTKRWDCCFCCCSAVTGQGISSPFRLWTCSSSSILQRFHSSSFKRTRPFNEIFCFLSQG